MYEKPDYSEQVARYKAFMLLVGALVLVVVGNTVCLWFNKITPELYEKVLLTLGVPTLLGMAFHAFFNENKKEPGDDKKIQVNADTVGTITSAADTSKGGQPVNSGGPAPTVS